MTLLIIVAPDLVFGCICAATWPAAASLIPARGGSLSAAAPRFGAMLESVAPGEECPHVFVRGTAARARAALREWPSRAADARCAWCGRLVDLRPWALDGSMGEPGPDEGHGSVTG